MKIFFLGFSNVVEKFRKFYKKFQFGNSAFSKVYNYITKKKSKIKHQKKTQIQQKKNIAEAVTESNEEAERLQPTRCNVKDWMFISSSQSNEKYEICIRFSFCSTLRCLLYTYVLYPWKRQRRRRTNVVRRNIMPWWALSSFGFPHFELFVCLFFVSTSKPELPFVLLPHSAFATTSSVVIRTINKKASKRATIRKSLGKIVWIQK